ncbi:MAG TPA: methylmalonyl Co-A mutase-associated GTPase MeaB [Bacteroidetes bacterium]|nr:methylmalonyl Co-A mutase-associated GTPase MeaB [Bacteroidota bacterium]
MNIALDKKPSSKINPKVLTDNNKKTYSLNNLIKGIKNNDRTVLGKAISLTESSLPEDEARLQEVLKTLKPSSVSRRIGITGIPGVGKSTFIEALGQYLTKLGKKVAVLAVDPSSEQFGGSILGDKTRMEKLSNNPNAFIRPTASGKVLGGVAKSTYHSILLCEAAGYDIILVETVGVGQAEAAVRHMVDFFLLLMLPGAGDELQGIKRGIMEIADAVFINKADGQNLNKAKEACGQYKQTLHLFPNKASGWIPKVSYGSAKEETGIKEVWDIIDSFYELTNKNGYFKTLRSEQINALFFTYIDQALRNLISQKPMFKKHVNEILAKLKTGKADPYISAGELVKKMINKY